MEKESPPDDGLHTETASSTATDATPTVTDAPPTATDATPISGIDDVDGTKSETEHEVPGDEEVNSGNDSDNVVGQDSKLATNNTVGDQNTVSPDSTGTAERGTAVVQSDAEPDDQRSLVKGDTSIGETAGSTHTSLHPTAEEEEDQVVGPETLSGLPQPDEVTMEQEITEMLPEKTGEVSLVRTPGITPPTSSDNKATLHVSPVDTNDHNSVQKLAKDSPKTSSGGEHVARLQLSSGGADSAGQSGSGDVVVVTGGCGFLGQHVVKMLQERAPHVTEIRVLDVKEFVQRLDYTATKPVRSIVGSVSDSRVVDQAVRGADSVIHVAGVISWGTFPDYAGMEESNVVGTVKVFNACIKHNVQRLVYCSTVDVAVGFQPVQGGDEESTPVPPPDGFMFPGYPETKYQGERVVMNSSKVLRQDGEKLQTLILRANVLYGELDNAYVINGLRGASHSNGTLRQIGDGMAMFQQAYVGNTAWAFVCADQAMRENPELTGQAFYIPDNTPVQNSFNFMRPYLEARGFRLSEGRLSYALVHSAVRVAEILAKGLSPVYRVSLPVQSHSVQYINTSIYFSGEKARRMLGYEPIFTTNEARQASLEYYKTVDLN